MLIIFAPNLSPKYVNILLTDIKVNKEKNILFDIALNPIPTLKLSILTVNENIKIERKELIKNTFSSSNKENIN